VSHPDSIKCKLRVVFKLKLRSLIKFNQIVTKKSKLSKKKKTHLCKNYTYEANFGRGTKFSLRNWQIKFQLRDYAGARK